MKPTTPYPWSKTEPGSGFFIPTLKAEQVREEVLLAAQYEDIRGKAVIGVYKGQFGVLFIRAKPRWAGKK